MKRVVAVLAGIFTFLAIASAAGAEMPCQQNDRRAQFRPSLGHVGLTP